MHSRVALPTAARDQGRVAVRSQRGVSCSAGQAAAAGGRAGGAHQPGRGHPARPTPVCQLGRGRRGPGDDHLPVRGRGPHLGDDSRQVPDGEQILEAPLCCPTTFSSVALPCLCCPTTSVALPCLCCPTTSVALPCLCFPPRSSGLGPLDHLAGIPTMGYAAGAGHGRLGSHQPLHLHDAVLHWPHYRRDPAGPAAARVAPGGAAGLVVPLLLQRAGSAGRPGAAHTRDERDGHGRW